MWGARSWFRTWFYCFWVERECFWGNWGLDLVGLWGFGGLWLLLLEFLWFWFWFFLFILATGLSGGWVILRAVWYVFLDFVLTLIEILFGFCVLQFHVNSSEFLPFSICLPRKHRKTIEKACDMCFMLFYVLVSEKVKGWPQLSQMVALGLVGWRVLFFFSFFSVSKLCKSKDSEIWFIFFSYISMQPNRVTRINYNLY